MDLTPTDSICPESTVPQITHKMREWQERRETKICEHISGLFYENVASITVLGGLSALLDMPAVTFLTIDLALLNVKASRANGLTTLHT